MRHFFRDGRGLSLGQSDVLSQISRRYAAFRPVGNRNVMERSTPAGLIGDNLFERLLLSLGRNRSDDKEYEGGENLRTTFELASPLLRLYNTHLSRIHHIFTTFAAGILNENVMKRCSESDETPKLVRSRYGSDQEGVDLVPTVYQLSFAQDLPWFYLCSTWLCSTRDRAVTRLRPFIGAPSEHHRSRIGTPSHKGRTSLGLIRVLGGIKAGKANTIFRPISNPLPPFFAQPNPSRTLAMTCLYTGYEQEMPKSETRITLESTKDKTRNTQETPKRETRIALESTKDKTRNTQEIPKRETRIRQESSNSTPKKLPERYCKGTGKVLKSGGKGTGEVLESYQRGTKEVLTASRSVVALEWDGGESQVASSTDDTSITVDDLRMNQSILKCFRLLCEDFRCKVESMVVKENRGRQIALKEVFGAKMKSKPFAYGLQLIALMIFCVFSSVFAQSPTKVGAVAKAKQEISTKGLVIGDSLPD